MIDVKPTVPQYKYITCDERFPAFVAGFGAGKTEAAVLRSIFGLLSEPGVNRGFYEPTYDLIRMIAFPRFEEALERLGLPFVMRKSPLNEVEILGFGKIIFRSMENPSRIVGYEHGDADIDELDTLKRDSAAHVFRQIMARNRQKKPSGKPNTIGVTTTPEGFRYVYEKWKKDPKDGFVIIQAPTRSNPHLPDGYIDSLKDSYPDNLLKAYLNGEFVNLTSGTVYSSYDRKLHRSDEKYIPGETVRIGCDFNVTKQAATIYVVRNGNEWHCVDELVDMYDTPDMVNKIRQKFPKSIVYIYPDASGKARKTVDASKSDIALLEQAGFKVRVNNSNPAVRDRIIAFNSALEAGRVKINDSTCPVVADCLEQQAYNDKGEPDKVSGNDHQNDATTYPIAYEMPISKPVSNINFKFAV
jgi:PBSX family phage terminase large subunit